jgi:O-antigen ligase
LVSAGSVGTPGAAWRPEAALLAAGSGALAAVMHFAGALKSVPGLAALPFDLTALAFAALLPSLVVLLLVRRWRLGRGLAVPLAAALGLVLWLVLAGAWSVSDDVLAEKLPGLVLLAPPMPLAGLLVGADAPALRRFCLASICIGVVVGGGIAWGVATRQVVLGGNAADTELVRVQYQLAGLAIACAAGLAALRVAEARGPARLAWLVLTAALSAAVLVPGGRLALLAAGLGVAGAPALFWGLRGRWLVALGWVAAMLGLGLLGLGLLLASPRGAAGLRTLERVFGEPNTATPARVLLWGEALRWGGEAAPLGLGTGGFPQAAGYGERRGMYPHNHALEALADGGLPGLVLWLGAFGGGVVLALRQARRVAPGRAARVAALTLPVALTVMVSTDLGNRMAWFALGLLLSLAVEAEARDV